MFCFLFKVFVGGVGYKYANLMQEAERGLEHVDVRRGDVGEH